MRVVNALGDTVSDDGIPDEVASCYEPQIFERGDKIYMTAPVQVCQPSDSQIEEFAFAQHLKAQAPNDHIMWLRGQYVEADHPNRNGAQWRAGELALKKLTPLLMPITVMHDPRTAVGTIADVKLLTPEQDNVPRSRLETYLALWAHRFPEIAREAELNAERGTLMQSMECLSPWYECSECGQAFQKLPQGAERARWCDHLKASNPSAGYVARAGQTSNASRILGDVCFTGTGLIFGTRGAAGAYTEAHLEVFQEEVAAHHQEVHTEPASGRTATMTLVQIEDSELATLRRERDEAKSEATAEKARVADLTPKLESAEAAKATAEETAAAEKKRADDLEQSVAGAELATKRYDALGAAFKAKIDAIPSVKEALSAQAKALDNDAWEARLAEIEALAGVKRDQGAPSKDDKDDKDKDGKDAIAALNGGTFSTEEVARFRPTPDPSGSTMPSDQERAATVGKLASIFSPPKANAGAAK
jgi:hypothetical protein